MLRSIKFVLNKFFKLVKSFLSLFIALNLFFKVAFLYGTTPLSPTFSFFPFLGIEFLNRKLKPAEYKILRFFLLIKLESF